jgi:hypothetical protein
MVIPGKGAELASFLGIINGKRKKQLIEKIKEMEKERGGKLEYVSLRDGSVLLQGKKVIIDGKEYKLKDLDIPTLRRLISLFYIFVQF